MSLLDRKEDAKEKLARTRKLEPEQRVAVKRLVGVENEAKWSVYRCPKCPYETKQRKGLPQVTHPCKTGARGGTIARNLKEDQ